jgi:two-component system, OmpR family, aerobic respiration control sensor histidine kinase ArcB
MSGLRKSKLNKLYEASLPELNSVLLNELPINVYVVDIDGFIAWGNSRMLSTLGLTSIKEFVGKTILIWDDPVESRWAYCKRVIETKSEITVEEFYRGSWYLAIRKPVIKNNEILGVLGISIDITDRKKAEEALCIALDQSELANRSKSEFIQNMSHDIRNPLASILGMAQMLYDTTTDTTQEYAHMLVQSSERLLDLLNNVLDLSSAAQENQLKQEPIELKKIAQGLKELLTPSLHTKQLQLNLDIDSKIPTVVGDANKIERILLNLLNNAIKFTEQGHITLKIESTKLKRKHVQLKLSVIDTGIGIPEDKLHRVFEEFFRVHPSYEGIYKGHGVGLYIVKKYTELMHGDVKVQSQLGIGTTFTITLELPITEQILKPDEETQIQTHIQADILLIEDEELALRAAKSILEKAGHTVTTARNLKEAHQQIKTHRFEIIITDLGLPDGSGMDFVRAYRKHEQSGHTPIFALTGHGSEVKEQCLASGIDAVFTKGKMVGLLKNIQLSLSNPITKSEIGSHTHDSEMHHTEQYFDAQQASELLGEEMHSMINLWLTETLPEERAALFAAYQNKDWDKLQHHAHKLKGSSAYVGTQKLYQACKALEDHLIFGRDQSRDVLFQNLIACIDETESVVKVWLAEH